MVVYQDDNTQLSSPMYNAFPLYSPNLKFLISIGSFVLLYSNDGINPEFQNGSGQIIAQVLSFNDTKNLIMCCVYLKLSTVIRYANTDSEGNNIRRICTGLAAGIPEIVSTIKKVTAKWDDVMDI